MDKHYKALSKECSKKNPSAEVIKIYLDLEHPVRQEWIMSLPVGSRWINIIENYPCFKEPEHVRNISFFLSKCLIVQKGIT